MAAAFSDCRFHPHESRVCRPGPARPVRSGSPCRRRPSSRRSRPASSAASHVTRARPAGLHPRVSPGPGPAVCTMHGTDPSQWRQRRAGSGGPGQAGRVRRAGSGGPGQAGQVRWAGSGGPGQAGRIRFERASGQDGPDAAGCGAGGVGMSWGMCRALMRTGSWAMRHGHGMGRALGRALVRTWRGMGRHEAHRTGSWAGPALPWP
jgi:hypothetical protein